VGLSHYRRYFNFKNDTIFPTDCFVPASPTIDQMRCLSDQEQYSRLSRLLKNLDVIIPRCFWFPVSAKMQYQSCVESEPWDRFETELRKKYGTSVALNDFFELTQFSTVFNMFCMKREVFRSYMEDMFPLIMEVYNTLGPRYDSYNNRYPAFLAERYLGLWLRLNRISFVEVPVVRFS